MLIGEAPGSEEDKTGLPFVGQAGDLLNLLLQAIKKEEINVIYQMSFFGDLLGIEILV